MIAEKYKDPRWQKIRLKVLERDQWFCQKCGDPEETLHVHHRYYEKGRELWDYPLSAFVTVCESCHEEEKDCMQDYCEALVQAAKESFWSEGVLDIAKGLHMHKFRHAPEVVASVIEWCFMNEEMCDYILDKFFEDLKRRSEKRKNEKKAS